MKNPLGVRERQVAPRLVAMFSLVVTAVLAGNFVVAELVGLIPTRYADYHLCSGLTRCCLYRQRRKWSRIDVASEVAQSTEIQIEDRKQRDHRMKVEEANRRTCSPIRK